MTQARCTRTIQPSARSWSAARPSKRRTRTMTKRVAIYARVSSGRQEQEQTVETQLMVTRDYCTAEGLATEEFIDEDWSGTSTLLEARPAGAALLAAIKAKEIDTVIVYKRDRLGRDL